MLVIAVPVSQLTGVVMGVSLVLLVGLGSLAARLGGAPMMRGAVRVAFWGVVAMAATALVGRLVGTVV
jgi:VIT1/CCC1 family predicted Fe2+/Mn2+ transporter